MTARPDTSDLFGWMPRPAASAERYPVRPGFKGPAGGTSAEAAEKIAPMVTGRRAAILAFIQERARGGLPPMMADEIGAALDFSPLYVRPRIAELRKLGLVEPAATRGRNSSGLTAHRWQPAAVKS